MGKLTPRDFRDIQEAVSNSDLPNERRIGLLDRIDTTATAWPSADDFDAIRAGLDYASDAFASCSTSEDVAWRQEDNAKLTRAREAFERLEGAL
jgi:hypothetical protein